MNVLSCLFRRLFLEALDEAFQSGSLEFFGDLESLRDSAAFSAYLDPLRKAGWVVLTKGEEARSALSG